MRKSLQGSYVGEELAKLGDKIGKEVSKYFEQAAKETMNEFYKDYPHPKYYERTGNLGNSYKTFTNPYIDPKTGMFSTVVSVTFSPAFMKPYEHNNRFIDNVTEDGFGAWLNTLDDDTKAAWGYVETPPEIVFDLDFLQGYHGGKTWGITTDWHNRQPAKRMSPPPYERMKKKVEKIAEPDRGKIAQYMNRDDVSASVYEAMYKDIKTEFDKIATAMGGGSDG